ncbi:ARABIDOPSIS THALIANA PLANT U-BOX 9, plant U-box 9 [Hibiscus trionum]|uniref:RING-type E3 ubiquitin transferase n=1 Tax=Hibiscus trionum TaxID=183268 RepID=A0A9W7M1V5_HIBTR|nr:ARABIDOPSIS THALIANA PLANT U-BOX 9, plant U-box 9 [Hibiscus trionum]
MAERDEPEAAGGGGKEAELKKELESVVNKMLEEDDFRIEKTVQAIRILTRLGESKLNKPAGLGIDDPILSESFKCPLSGKIMGDPVILASGQTYDRPYIENWLNQGNLTCFQTKEVLSHSFLTPNCLVRELISRWCGVSGVAVPEPPKDVRGLITTRDRLLLSSLLDKMSSSLSDQKEAAKELRRLTQALESNRVAFCGLPGAISRLLSPLSESVVESHPDLQEDLITTVLNLSTHGNNKKAVAENPVVVPHLIESMKFGTMETIKNAAAALSTLSELHSNKLIIGRSMAPMALLRLLDGGHPLAMKEAASAISNLCTVDENKTLFVTIGTVNVIMRKINDSLLVDELLGILALLSQHPTAIYQLSEVNTIHCLMRILRQSNSSPTKENCVVILFAVCSRNRDLLKVLWIEEEHNKTLAELADVGIGRGKRKARDLINKIDDAFLNFPSTS